MGCVICSKACVESTSLHDNKSFDSLRSSNSDNHFQKALTASLEGLYPVEEPRPPPKAKFEKANFAGSVVVYFNNSKQNSLLNPYSHSLEKNPEIYFRFFSNLWWNDRGDVFAVERERSFDNLKSKDSIDVIQKSETFQKHLRITHKLFNSILGIAVNEDISATATTLKRIGAKHAELGIPARHVFAFKESFLNCIELSLDPDKEVIRIWEAFIKYVVNMIVSGMNDHYKKVIFVMWNVRPQKACACPYNIGLRRPSGINADAMMSLRNMATTIAGQVD